MELEFTENSPFELRQHQIEAVTSVEDAWREGKSALLDMATGSGKTIIFASLMKRHNIRTKGKALAIAHTEELVSQAIEKIERQTGIPVEREQAKHSAERRSPFVVGSVQTLQRARLESWPRDYFSMLAVDEAHHSPAKTYRNLISHFNVENLVGVSATCDRFDRQSLGDIYDTVAYSYPLHRAIRDNNLVPIIGERVLDFDIDLSELKISKGDYNENELGELLLKYFSPIAHNIKSRSEGLKSLVFMPNVESSRLMAEELKGKGIPAEYLAGHHSSEERKRILYNFHSGNITHLCACNILLEGFDEPAVEAIVMLRPTPSRPLYAQAVGRGTRLFPGKENVKLIEFTYNSKNLSLASTFDLFAAAGYEEKVRELAINMSGESVNYLDALSEAHNKYYSKEYLLERLVNKDYNFIKFDPVAAAEMAGADITGEFDIHWNGRKLEGMATIKQCELLNRYGIKEPHGLTKAQASVLIDSLSKVVVPMPGEITDGQKWKLKSLGVKPREMNGMMKAQASILIEQLLQRNKERDEKLNTELQF